MRLCKANKFSQNLNSVRITSVKVKEKEREENRFSSLVESPGTLLVHRSNLFQPLIKCI